MAVTRKSDVTNSIQTIWSKKVFWQAERLTFWHNFEGPEGSNMPIIRKDDLMGGGADTVKVDIFLNLVQAGLTGDTTLLEGNEEKLRLRQLSFTASRIKHAVRTGDLADLLVAHNLRSAAAKALSRWLASTIDDRMFNELTGQSGFSTIPTKNKWAAGSATTRDTVADGDTTGRLTLDDISRLKAYFQTEIKGEPLRMNDGQEYFGLVLHPYTAMSLKINDPKWAQAQREAMAAGPSNPLFTGAFGTWDGVIIYESQRVPRSANSGAVLVADNCFFGAQAAMRGYMRTPSWREQEFSYAEEYGIATIADYGQKITSFDLNAAETTGDATDDTWIGGMVVYAAAAAPTQP